MAARDNNPAGVSKKTTDTATTRWGTVRGIWKMKCSQRFLAAPKASARAIPTLAAAASSVEVSDT